MHSRHAALQDGKDDYDSPVKADEADEFESERKVTLHFDTGLHAADAHRIPLADQPIRPSSLTYLTAQLCLQSVDWQSHPAEYILAHNLKGQVRSPLPSWTHTVQSCGAACVQLAYAGQVGRREYGIICMYVLHIVSWPTGHIAGQRHA